MCFFMNLKPFCLKILNGKDITASKRQLYPLSMEQRSKKLPFFEAVWSYPNIELLCYKNRTIRFCILRALTDRICLR